jgi:hypothetical protein
MKRFWKWYDKLNEPWRFILCLAMLFPLSFTTVLLERGHIIPTAIIAIWTVFLVGTRLYCSRARSNKKFRDKPKEGNE